MLDVEGEWSEERWQEARADMLYIVSELVYRGKEFTVYILT